MAKTRSPNYPAVSLPEAINLIRKVYQAAHRAKLSREEVALHLGYRGLTGSSNPIISALLKYGLLEGRADSLQVSQGAVTILVDQADSPEQTRALQDAAHRPALFSEIAKHFEKLPSEETLRIHLEKRGFTSEAAQRVSRNYRATMSAVVGQSGDDTTVDSESNDEGNGDTQLPLVPRVPTMKQPGTRQDVFALPEGNAVLQWPDPLSAESASYLREWLELVIRRATAAAKKSQPAESESD